MFPNRRIWLQAVATPDFSFCVFFRSRAAVTNFVFDMQRQNLTMLHGRVTDSTKTFLFTNFDSEGFKKGSHHMQHLSLSMWGNIDDEVCQCFLLLGSIYEAYVLRRFAEVEQQHIQKTTQFQLQPLQSPVFLIVVLFQERDALDGIGEEREPNSAFPSLWEALWSSELLFWTTLAKCSHPHCWGTFFSFLKS